MTSPSMKVPAREYGPAKAGQEPQAATKKQKPKGHFAGVKPKKKEC